MKKYITAFSVLFSAVLIVVMALTLLAHGQEPDQPSLESPESPEIIPDPNLQFPSQEPPQGGVEEPLNGDEQFGTKIPPEGGIDPGMGGNEMPPDGMENGRPGIENGQPGDPPMEEHSSDQLM